MAKDGLLMLPSEEDVDVTVFQTNERLWVAESKDEARCIDDQAQLVVGGQMWRVCLPALVVETQDVSRRDRAAGLDAASLRSGARASSGATSIPSRTRSPWRILLSRRCMDPRSRGVWPWALVRAEPSSAWAIG